ncbi:MAG: hypothetical protein NC483_01240 [Ruminococcus sp.]|nr:hypothetical protein [Ruminococcus sp.]
MKGLNVPGLKERFGSDKDYDKFIDKIDVLYVSFLTKYAYLGLPEDTWVKLFSKVITANLPKTDDVLISIEVTKHVNNYIRKQIKENKPRIIANFLIMLYKDGLRGKELLKRFIRQLEVDNFIISEEYYQILKEYSELLKNTLINLGIFDLSLKNLKDCLNKKEDFYDKFRLRGISYAEKKKLLDYALSLTDDKERIKNNFLDRKNNEETRKFSYFVNNYSTIVKIHNLIKEQYNGLDSRDIDRVIMGFSCEEMENTFNEYWAYATTNNNDFILRIINKIGNLRITSRKTPLNYTFKSSTSLSKDAKEKAEPKKKDEPVPTVKKPETTKPIQNANIHYLNENEIKTNLYGLFNKPNEIDENIHRSIINRLWDALDINKKKIIKKFISYKSNSDEEYNEALEIINYLREQYKKEIAIDGSKAFTCNTIYEYMPKKEGLTEKEHKKIVDVLFKRRTPEERNLVINCLSKKSLPDDTFYQIMRELEEFYNTRGSEILANLNNHKSAKSSKRRENIYEFFPLKDDINEEVRKEIVDILLGKRTEEEKDLIDKYIKDEISTKSSEYKKFRSCLVSMQASYNRYGKKILNDNKKGTPKKEVNIYKYFPIKEGMTEDERNEIVNILIR